MSGEIECAECIRLLAALAGRSEGGPGVRIADIITLDGDRVWLNDDFLDAVMEARAHLAVHANRTEPELHTCEHGVPPEAFEETCEHYDGQVYVEVRDESQEELEDRWVRVPCPVCQEVKSR